MAMPESMERVIRHEPTRADRRRATSFDAASISLG
eukprot:CAMPEP_0179470944 /NCGR_PEP_ID=MMETSP0799-20121207/51261_1 /TAXON_ID=46947 /ORGANISM="Geminigera cryophila, Strain CCMP2564" /LENGTH=34 /DNA_ID= /DNA_START= /DNA_END= /DNA_ORIENTATION=